MVKVTFRKVRAICLNPTGKCSSQAQSLFESEKWLWLDQLVKEIGIYFRELFAQKMKPRFIFHEPKNFFFFNEYPSSFWVR